MGNQSPRMPLPAGLSVSAHQPAPTPKDQCGTTQHWIHDVWPWCAAVLSGILLALCFPRWNQGWLCWIALTPLLCALWFSKETGRRIWLKKAALGYVTGLIFFTVTFRWIGCSLAVLFDNEWLALLSLVLALYMAFYLAFWAWFTGVLIRERQFLQSRGNLWIALLCSCTWVAQEWVRGWLFSGFGWNGLGVALHDDPVMIQVADITGIGGLSFVAAFTNMIAVITVRRLMAEIGRIRIRPHYDFSLTMALIVVVFFYGVRTLLKKETGTPLRVAAIQANIPQKDQFDEANGREILERYANLSEVALRFNPQLLIWPESSVPGGMFSSKENYKFIREFANRPDLNFLLGTDDFDTDDSYNAAVLLTGSAEKEQIYHKIHLVPFGEYIPLRHSFPLFAWFCGGMVPGDFKAGSETRILETKNPAVKIAPLICFEDTDGNLTRQFVLKGAEVLANITNDGWFLKSEGAEQHLANAVFRAVETRRPLVRAANTGITCFIDRCGRDRAGRIKQTAPEFSESMLLGQIEISNKPEITFYVKYGELFSIICFSITSIYLIILIFPISRAGAPPARGNA